MEDGESLSSLGVLLQSFHTMSNNILAEKLKQQRPDIYIRPDIRNVRVLEFYKAKQVFEEARITSYNVCYTKLLRCIPELKAG